MEAFSGFLRLRISQGGFCYHPKFASIGLSHDSHLSFVDDMFVLCGAEVQSFELIKAVLKDFFHFSGLQPNLGKSACFFAAVSSDRKQVLGQILDIPEADLCKVFGCALDLYKVELC